MPIPVIILCAVLLLLVFLLTLRVRITVRVGERTRVELRVLFLRFRLYPKRKKLKAYSQRKLERIRRRKAKKATKKALKKQKKKAKKKALAQSEDKKPKTLRQKIRFARGLLAAILRRTHKHLRLHAARLHVLVATGDAATTAVAYGAVSQSMSYLLALLDRITKLKAAEPDVLVAPDFTSEKSHVDIHLVLSMRVFGALCTLFGVIFSYIGDKLNPKQKKKRKHKTTTSAKQAECKKGA